jgi:hypothetical protein
MFSKSNQAAQAREKPLQRRGIIVRVIKVKKVIQRVPYGFRRVTIHVNNDDITDHEATITRFHIKLDCLS